MHLFNSVQEVFVNVIVDGYNFKVTIDDGTISELILVGLTS